MTTATRTKVRQDELPALVGKLDYLKGMVDMERKLEGEYSYLRISRTMEEALVACRDIANRLLHEGLEETP